MAYKLKLGHLEIHCDTLVELEAALDSKHLKLIVPIEYLSLPSDPGRENKRRAAIKKSWDEAKLYAEAHGISKWAARKLLAKQRLHSLASKKDNSTHLTPDP